MALEPVMDGLAVAEIYHNNYGIRAQELKVGGDKVLGYLSALTPVEIMSAAGVVPIRLKYNVSEAVTKGDAYMETNDCPFIRKVFDTALKGTYDFLDGMVIPRQCDSVNRTNDVWRHRLNLSYSHFLNFPHVTDNSLEFMQEILRAFMVTLEDLVGHEITDVALSYAITGHWYNRRAMRQLYDLRKTETPLISGTELMKVLVAAMSIPVHECSALIESVIIQVERRPVPQSLPRKRIMLVGHPIDDVRIPQAIEEAGAWLVTDDISIGGKMYWNDVDMPPGDPLRAIAEQYLRKLKVHTTFEASGDTYQENLEARFSHIKRLIEEFKVDGVILLVYEYCDPYGFEVPAIKNYIESAGTPVLYVEDEYSISSFGRLKTRVEAFLEMIA